MKNKSPGPPPSGPSSDSDDGRALRIRLRDELAQIAKTHADLDDFCLTYLPEVQQQFTASMALKDKQNLIRSMTTSAELERALSERRQDVTERLLTVSGAMERDPLLARVMAACRHKERRHSKLRIEPLIAEPWLRLAAVSYETEGYETRYALGATDRPVNQSLLKRFVRTLRTHCLDTNAGVPPRLICKLKPGAVLPDELVQAARSLQPPVVLRTLDAYENLIDLTDAVTRQTQRLAADPHYPAALYVPQRMDVSPGTRLHFDPSRAPEPQALQTVSRWLEKEGGRFILILGDFGTGKTFLLREAARLLAQHGSSVKPLICELRQIEKAQDLDTLLVQHMQIEQIEPIDPKALRHMCRMGKVVLLFDGFDELALRTDYGRAAQHLETLIMAVEEQAKVLVTSRTQHFLNDAQVATVLAKRLELVPTLVGRLRPFEPDQVLQFLRNQLGDPDKAQARFELIDEVKDLLGLSKNPRMLSFIAQIQPERLRALGQIGAAQLYKALIDQWIEGEIKRKTEGVAGPMLTAAQINQALDRLALVLWRKTEPTASLEELEAATAGILSQLDLEVGVAAQQLGSSSLLCRGAQERFSFYHHSLLEWFLARQLVDEIRSGTIGLLGEKAISRLMAEFLRGFLGEDEAGRWVRKILGAHDQTDPGPLVQSALVLAERMTISVALNLEGQDLRGRDLSQQNLRNANLRGADLREQSLQGKDLRGADLSRADLTDANLKKADLREADLRGANFTRANLLGVDLRGAQTEGAIFHRSKLLGASADDALQKASTTGAAWLDRPHIEHQPRLWAPGPSSIAWGPSGDLIALALGGPLIGLHDARSGACVRVLEGHTGPVWQVAFSPGESSLASASEDQTVRVWSLVRGACTHTLSGHQGGVRTVAFSPRGGLLASGSWDGTVRLWDPYEGRCKSVLVGHRRPVTCLAFSPDGSTLLTGSEDGAIRIWDSAEGTLVQIMHPTVEEVRSLAFAPSDRVIAVGSQEGLVLLLDPADGALRRTLRAERGPIHDLSWSPDGSVLVYCAGDSTLSWNPRLGRSQPVFNGDKNTRSVAFSPDGGRIASVTKEGVVLVWDHQSGECLQSLCDWVPAVMGGMFGPGALGMMSISEDGMVCRWERTSCSQSVGADRHAGLESVSPSSSGRSLIVCGGMGEVQILEPDSLPRRVLWDRRSLSAALSPDERRLAVSTLESTVEQLDLQHNRKLHTLTGHKDSVRSLAFSPDGSILASASADHTIRLWGSAHGEGRHTLRGHTKTVRSVAFSPDGLRLISGSEDRTVRVWDPERGSCERTLTGHGDTVCSVVFSPKGDLFASGSRDRAVKLWHVGAVDSFQTLIGHREAVTCLWFSPDGKILASGSEDQTIRLWELATGRCLRVLITGKSGWYAVDPETGRYGRSDETDGSVWFVSGLCRFELAELEELFPDLRVTDDVQLLPIPPAP